jgi:hypothetical protein
MPVSSLRELEEETDEPGSVLEVEDDVFPWHEVKGIRANNERSKRFLQRFFILLTPMHGVGDS